jgi:hypothetical protein
MDASRPATLAVAMTPKSNFCMIIIIMRRQTISGDEAVKVFKALGSGLATENLIDLSLLEMTERRRKLPPAVETAQQKSGLQSRLCPSLSGTPLPRRKRRDSGARCLNAKREFTRRPPPANGKGTGKAGVPDGRPPRRFLLLLGEQKERNTPDAERSNAGESKPGGKHTLCVQIIVQARRLRSHVTPQCRRDA